MNIRKLAPLKIQNKGSSHQQATWPLGMELNLMSYGKWLRTTGRVTRPMDLFPCYVCKMVG